MEHIYWRKKVDYVDSIEGVYIYKCTTGHNQFCNFHSGCHHYILVRNHTDDVSSFKKTFTAIF